MGIYIPYLVVLAVILIFLLVCWLVFRDKKGTQPASTDQTVHNEAYYNRPRVDYGAAYYGADKGHVEETPQAVSSSVAGHKHHTAASPETAASVDAAATAGNQQADSPLWKKQTMPISLAPETTMPEDVETALDATRLIRIDRSGDLMAPAEAGLDATQPISAAGDLTATRAVKASELRRRLQDTNPDNPDATIMLDSIKDKDGANTLTGRSPAKAAAANPVDPVDMAIAHFVNSFGIVSDTSRDSARDITGEALNRLNIHHDFEVKALLENIVVQEALLCMQKAYVAAPTAWMRETALEAFVDVVQEPKSSTPYLVAFDALRILPHLSLGHFQAMAIILLLQYSRNSNNYSQENFRHYVEKYIEPFLSEIPRDDSMYRQLEYLRCSVQEQDRTAFNQILSGSYPFVFNYRGFTADELDRALGDEFLDDEFVVNSLNSSMYKLAIVDESMATRLFRLAKIGDEEVQRRLLALMKSKPTSFTGAESRDILERISPTLVELGKVYNNTGLSGMSLTLLGLYLARAHVKVTIGEEFDLSRWF